MISRATITQEDFDSLAAYSSDSSLNLNWNLVFTLPTWLKTWWQNFGHGADLFIRTMKDDGRIIGVAPLQIRSGTASIIGSVDVCDYQDFIVVPGLERDFYTAVLDELPGSGVHDLHLEAVRPDSSVSLYLLPLARERGYQVDYNQTDVSADLDLPTTWDLYLASLEGKQRHEIRRKMRNLSDLGQTTFRIFSEQGDIQTAAESFLKLFPESRGDKAQFMTGAMETFFRTLTSALSQIGVVRFASLELGGQPLAMVMYFDYNNSIYLYNSGYDPAYKSASVGIISKALCVQDSITRQKEKFDFLKGAEQYKYYLGGKELKLFSCHIRLP